RRRRPRALRRDRTAAANAGALRRADL
ncbi:MAG: hypothetical protein AVDCRST_MAG67-2717, partial [uncultured Solirubrobacteraceae bacterium]